MTDEQELKLVRENLFGPRIEYVTLFRADDEHATSLLKSITRQGADAVLTMLLVSANLHPTTRTYDKPWGFFAEHYQMGDYHLVWSMKDDVVAIYEETIPSDVYSNV